MVWIVIIVFVLLAGIILLNSSILLRKPTLEQFLQSFAKLLEGKLRPVDGQPESFQVDFFFDGQSFVYEDVPDRGFKEEARKGYLKTMVHSDFTLYFTEKPRSTTIRTDLVISSQIADGPVRPDVSVVLPSSLKGLNVQTNNIRLANKLLANARIVDILLEFRNVDSRGYPSMSWRIVDGVMVLEFHPAAGKIPNYHELISRVSSIEDYLQELAKIIRFFKGLSPG